VGLRVCPTDPRLYAGLVQWAVKECRIAGYGKMKMLGERYERVVKERGGGGGRGEGISSLLD
jgi:hypothetical protein